MATTQEIVAARLGRFGWEPSPLALLLLNMEPGSLIAVACALAVTDASPLHRWSMQEQAVASSGGIVFW